MSHLSPVSLACTAHAVQHSQQNPQLQLKIAVEAMTHLIGDNRSMNVIWLVVYLPPLKNMSSSVGVISYYSQYMRKKQSCNDDFS